MGRVRSKADHYFREQPNLQADSKFLLYEDDVKICREVVPKPRQITPVVHY